MARRYADQGLAAIMGFKMGSQMVRDWRSDQADVEAGEAAKRAGEVTAAEDPNTINDYQTAAQGIQDGSVGDESMTPGERTAASDAYAKAAQTGTKHYLGRGDGSAGQAFDRAPTPQEQRIASIRAMGASYAGAGQQEKAMKWNAAADSAEANQQQRELTGMQIDEGRDKADKRRRLNKADSNLRAWGDKHVQKDDQGNPIVDDDSFARMGKMRSILLAQQGLHEEAVQNAEQTMQYVARKIQSESGVRAAETDKALRLFDAGDYSAAMKVYDMVPDGSKVTGVNVGKDGQVTVERVSSLDGSKLSPAKFKDLAELRAIVEGIKDPNAVINHVERTFKHDIESRKVKADETRAGAAATSAQTGVNAENRKNSKEDALLVASSAYQAAIDTGNEKEIKKARVAFIGAGGKPEKIEAMKADFTPNPMGMGGTVKQIGPDGTVIVTPIPMDAKGTTRIAAPGAQKAAPTQADIQATAKKYGITEDEVKKRLGIQ